MGSTDKVVGGYKRLSKEEAMGILLDEFHKTRFTYNLSIDPKIVAAILGYNEEHNDAIGYEDE